MDTKAVFDRIEALEQEYIRFWIDVVNLESPTGYKAGVDAVGEYFEKKALERGWLVQRHREPVSGDALCITMNPNAAGKPICLSGHMDTVHPIGSFGSPAVHCDEQYIYGPGAGDCKGGTVAAFLAMAALEDCGFRARPVKLILQSDEENSSQTSEKRTVDFMAQCAKDCVGFLNLEGGALEKVTTGRKGICKYRITVHGRAVHASNCYKGVSAIAAAAKLILKIEEHKDPDGITCNCGLISGGTAVNTVPEVCSFDIDVRFRNEADKNAIHRELEALTAAPGTEGATCRLEQLSVRVAMEENESVKALFHAANRIVQENGLPPMVMAHRNGGSDAADMVARGIPALDSLGVAARRIHSLSEHSDLDSLVSSAKRLAVLTVYL